jgi:hypothetical protein
MKTSTLTGAALDWAVAKCEDKDYTSADATYATDGSDKVWAVPCSPTLYQPSTNWAQGGPILTREHISRTMDHSGLWIAYWTDGYTEGDEGKYWMQCDREELVAGLRCYVASQLGDEVEIPEELN